MWGPALDMAHDLPAEPDGYVPFRTRFLAWWNGLEPDALNKAPSANRDKPVSPAAIEVDSGNMPATEIQALRRELLQKLWGEGFLEPGGSDYTIQLIKPAAPTPDQSILDLAPGLCGGAKAVAEEYGVWVDAMEPDPDLFAAAEVFCEQKGVKKVTLSEYDPAKLTLPKKRYNSIYARERFYMFEDKKCILEAVRHGLKPGGQFLFTDLVLANREGETDAVSQWRETLPSRPFFWTMKEYKDALQQMKFDVRVFADETDSICANILRGWSDLAEGLADGTMGRAFVAVLMTEAERWLYQAKAMEQGQLRFLRVHAIHHGNKIRLLSDP